MATQMNSQILIIPNVFNIPTQYCEGDNIPALSDYYIHNNITRIYGTWSPSEVNNTVTQTYVFTPLPSQFGSSVQTVQFEIKPKVQPVFYFPSILCESNSYVLQNNSSNGITGYWSPVNLSSLNSSYTFHPNSNQCARPVTYILTVVKNSTPIFTQVAPICHGSILTPLPLISDNGISGTWSPALNNTATTTYTFKPSDQCARTTTMTITVLPLGSSPCIQTACLNDITLTSPETKILYSYRAINKIESNSNYTVDSGKEIYFKSQSSIYLKPNTKINKGAKFVAKIEACAQSKTNEEKVFTMNGEKGVDSSESSFSSEIKLFPNPANSDISISSTNTQITAVSIFYIDGKLLYQKSQNSTLVNININDYKKGVYIIEVLTADNKSKKIKFIKE